MSHRQVGDFINAHNRLENPDGLTIKCDYAGVKRACGRVNCPKNLYEMCLDCWNLEVCSFHLQLSRPAGTSWFQLHSTLLYSPCSLYVVRLSPTLKMN